MFSSARDFDPTIDYYGVLGVKKFATQEEVKKKYLELVKLYHPDRNPNADQNRFKNITAAYTVLSDENTKRRYDNSRGGGSTFGSANTGSAKANPNSHYWQRYGNQQTGWNTGSSYGNQYRNAREEYRRAQYNNQKTQQTYQKWYQDTQRRRREQQFEQDQYRRGKFYKSYEDFRRDYDKQERHYQQNFESTNYYNAKEDFEREWHSIRGQPRSPHEIKNGLIKLYFRIIIFMFVFAMVRNLLMRLEHNRRRQEALYYPAVGGIDGVPVKLYRGKVPHSLMPEQMGPAPFHNLDENFKKGL